MLKDYFFVFDEMDDEIEKKLNSMNWSDHFAAELFSIFVESAGLDGDTRSRCNDLFGIACNAYHSVGNSIVHPFRVMVSFIFAGAQPTYDNVSLGLCHNIREVGKGRFDDIEREYFSAAVQSCIKILTIDRERELDPVYLDDYYARIEDEGLMRFKGFDKLDNFLCFVRRDVKPFYYGIVDDRVCPSLARTDPKLGDYLVCLSRYARSPIVRERYAR